MKGLLIKIVFFLEFFVFIHTLEALKIFKRYIEWQCSIFCLLLAIMSRHKF
ncbi:MAG: hypothetical protein ACI86X_001220, partial [Moritella sp.]